MVDMRVLTVLCSKPWSTCMVTCSFNFGKIWQNKEVALIPDLDAMWSYVKSWITSHDFTSMKINRRNIIQHNEEHCCSIAIELLHVRVQRHFGPECISRGLEVLLHVFLHLLNLALSAQRHISRFTLPSPLLFASVHFCSLLLLISRSHNDLTNRCPQWSREFLPGVTHGRDSET